MGGLIWRKLRLWAPFMASAGVGSYFIVTAMLIGILKMKESIRLDEYDYLEKFFVEGFLMQLAIYIVVVGGPYVRNADKYTNLDTSVLVAQQPIGLGAVRLALRYPGESVFIYLMPICL